MRLPVDLQQLRRVDVGVALRRAQARVAEQLLNRAQVGAALQQVRRKRMAQRVRADAEPRAARGDVAADQPIDAADAQPRPAVVHEQRLAVAPRRRLAGPSPAPGERRLADGQLLPILQVVANRRGRAGVERHQPLLPALAQHPRHPRAQVDVVEVEAGQLAEPQPRRVEQLEDRAIAAAERRRRPRRLEQRGHLLFGEVRRHADLALRRRDQRARIVLDELLPPQVAQERPDRGELARRGRPRLPARVQLGEKAADGVAIERRRLELARLHAADRRPT